MLQAPQLGVSQHKSTTPSSFKQYCKIFIDRHFIHGVPKCLSIKAGMAITTTTQQKQLRPCWLIPRTTRCESPYIVQYLGNHCSSLLGLSILLFSLIRFYCSNCCSLPGQKNLLRTLELKWFHRETVVRQIHE